MNKNRKRKYRKNKYRKDQNLGRTRIGRTTFWNNKTKNALFVKIAQSRTKLHNIAENSTKLSFDKNAHLYKIAFSQRKTFLPNKCKFDQIRTFSPKLLILTKQIHFDKNAHSDKNTYFDKKLNEKRMFWQKCPFWQKLHFLTKTHTFW